MLKVLFHALLLVISLPSQKSAADPLDQWAPRELQDVSIWFPAESFSISGFAAGNGLLLCVGQGGDFGTIQTSPDGVSWTVQRPIPDDPRYGFGALRSVTFGAGKFVAVGWARSIYSSADGRNWTSRNAAEIGPGFRDVSWGNGWFVAVGDVADSNISVSPDGERWTALAVARPGGLSGISHGSGRFVAVGSGVTNTDDLGVMISTNAIDWLSIDPGPNSEVLTRVTFGNKQFVAVGYSAEGNQAIPVIMRSPDGVTWSSAPFDPVAQIEFGFGMFIAVGTSGTLLTSSDGVNWERRVPPTTRGLRAVGFGAGSVLLGGERATLLQSSPVIQAHMRQFPQLLVTGLKGRAARIEATDDISRPWQTLTKFILTGGTDMWADPDATNLPKRFYRAVLEE